MLVLLLNSPLAIQINGAQRWFEYGEIFGIRPESIAVIAVILMLGYCEKKYGNTEHGNFFKTLLEVYEEEEDEVSGSTDKKSFISEILIIFKLGFKQYYHIVIPTVMLILFLFNHAFIDSYSYLIFVAIAANLLQRKSVTRKIVCSLYWLVMLAVSFLELNMEDIFWFKQYSSDTMSTILISIRASALSNGGFFGVGLGNAAYKTESLYNQKETFVVVWEELGFMGIVAIIFLFVLLIIGIIKVRRMAKNNGDVFGNTVSTLIACHFSFALIEAVISQFWGITVVSLPFFSAMNLDMLLLYIEIGIVTGICLNGEAKKTGEGVTL